MADIYFATTGNDSTGNGSSGNPYATLAKAYSASSSGDTLHAAAGTYTWASAAMANRTIQGAGAATTIFDAGGTAAAVTWQLNGATVNDCTFRNNGFAITGAPPSMLTNTSGFSTAFTCNRCIFHDLYVAVDGGDLSFACGVFGTYARDGNGPTITLAACLLYNIFKYSGASRGAIFCDTAISGGSWGLSLTGCTLDLNGTGTATLTAIISSLQNHWGTILIKNSIIRSSTGGSSAMWVGNVTTPVPTYSCLYSVTGYTAGTGVITNDPLFIDAANGDYRLRPSSPCIAAGTLT